MHPPRCPYWGNASALRASRGCLITIMHSKQNLFGSLHFGQWKISFSWEFFQMEHLSEVFAIIWPYFGINRNEYTVSASLKLIEIHIFKSIFFVKAKFECNFETILNGKKRPELLHVVQTKTWNTDKILIYWCFLLVCMFYSDSIYFIYKQQKAPYML